MGEAEEENRRTSWPPGKEERFGNKLHGRTECALYMRDRTYSDVKT